MATGGQMMPPWLWLWLVGDLAVLIPAEVSNERHQIALYTGHGEIAPQVTTSAIGRGVDQAESGLPSVV
jgi:hypothetical protein